jgi:hypothetical protein
MHGAEPQQIPPDGGRAGHLPIEGVPVSDADASRVEEGVPEVPPMAVPVESFAAAPGAVSAGPPSGDVN